MLFGSRHMPVRAIELSITMSDIYILDILLYDGVAVYLALGKVNSTTSTPS